MTKEKLTELLNDAAAASPQADLVPDAIRGARRHEMFRGVMVAATVVPVIAISAALMISNQPTAGVLAPAASPSVSATPSPAGSESPSATASVEPTPAESATPEKSPSEVPSLIDDSGMTPNAFDIPDSVGLTKSEYSWIGKKVHIDDIGGANMTPVSGLSCDPGNPDADKLTAGRWWAYYEEGSNSVTDGAIDVIVSGWDDGAAALKAISRDKGPCISYTSFKLVSASPDAIEFNLSNPSAPDSMVVIRRVNNVLVAVTYLPGNKDKKLKRADQIRALADTLAERAKVAGLDQQ